MGFLKTFKSKRSTKSQDGDSPSEQSVSKNAEVNPFVPDDPSVVPIPESEKQYYNDDFYYQPVAFKGGPFEQQVVTFEQWKQRSYPSRNGLYVPEILMLFHCSKYPNPKTGYPGHWWYKYGIKNVGAVYESLVERGFLELGPKGKYQPTAKGIAEMNENEYVEYMHNNTKYNSFTVWDLNKIIHEGDDRPFMEIVNEHIGVLDAQAKDAHKAYIDDLKKTNPKKAEEEQSLDNLIATFLERDQEFKETQNYDLYIAFWEDTWKNEDMSHFGSYWSFRLAELYIDTGRYDDALDFIRERKVDKPFYIDRANSMEEKVLKLKAKEERKRKA